MSIKWRGKLEERRIELVKLGLRYNKIAKILSREFDLNISAKAVENRGYRTNTLKKNISNINIEPLNSFSKTFINEQIIDNSLYEDDQNLFPEECYDVESELCLTPEKISKLKEIHNIFQNNKINKILSLSDLHAPFIDFKSVEKAVLENLDADVCLLNGDVYDGLAMSRFDKLNEFDIEIEFKQVFELLDVLTKKFKHVVWVGGNHDMRRFESFVMKNFGPSMRKFVLKRLNPMDYIAEKYNNLIIVPHDWIQIGDVIFAHLQNYSAVDMKTVTTNNEIFNAMRNLLPNPNYRAVVIGHTHQWGKLIKNDVLLMEQGKLCHMQDYRFQKPTKTKWTTGYAVIHFNDMKVDFNKTNVVHIDDVK